MLVDNRNYDHCMYGTCLYESEPECKKKDCEAYLEEPGDLSGALTWDKLKSL